MRALTRLVPSAAALLLAASAMAQPANDDCPNSFPAVVGDNPFTNIGATTDADPDCLFSGSDVWYIFTPPETGTYVIDLCGSDFDTTLAIYPDCGASAIACNDDSCGLSSQLTVSGFEGISFFIRVAGFAGDTGSGVMHINGIPSSQWDETLHGGGDAGDTIATAQTPTGTGDLHDIGGTVEGFDSADIYRIRICDPGSFSATSDTPATGGADTQMFLFDATGAGVQMNDDDPSGFGGVTSAMDNSFVTAPGIYYIAISHYDVDPTNAASAEIWADQPFGAVRAPDGLANGGDTVLSGWDNVSGVAFSYGISLTGVCFVGCAADFNGDTIVDFNDYLDFVDALSTSSPAADFNGDTIIDFNDYLDFVDAFAQGC